MTTGEDLKRLQETTAERVEREARATKARLKETQGWKAWKGTTSGRRMIWAISLGILLLFIASSVFA